ncbi:MAG: phosphotransferase [Lentisphaerales bacterium]|nr:phosphotransferase [Lentisphaerales bacterium]
MTHGQDLIHGDLHTGSIMINEQDTRVIDPEFSFIGPMAYDLVALIQNLVPNYLTHFAHTKDTVKRQEYQNYVLQTIADIWHKFSTKFNKV